MAEAATADCPGEPGKVAPVVDRNASACHVCQFCVEACPENALVLAPNR